MRFGADVRLPRERPKDKHGQPIKGAPLVAVHTAENVYSEMMVQVLSDYKLDPRTLSVGEILYFYNTLRERLQKHSKPRKSK